MKSLGFIETRGLLAAIEAADAMVKSADVQLLGRALAGGGLVNVTVAGDVSAVQAAVATGAASVRQIAGAELVSCHVIARPWDDVASLVTSATIPDLTAVTALPEDAGTQDDSAETDISLGKDKSTVFTTTELKKNTAAKLRRIASDLAGVSLSPQELQRATKKKLIEAILNATAS